MPPSATRWTGPLMFLTGARVSEALAVEWDDIDFRKKTVLIKQTKLGNERRAHLPQRLIVALANIPKSNSRRTVFWYETRNHCLIVWRRTAERAKIAPYPSIVAATGLQPLFTIPGSTP
jgi:integrase